MPGADGGRHAAPGEDGGRGRGGGGHHGGAVDGTRSHELGDEAGPGWNKWITQHRLGLAHTHTHTKKEEEEKEKPQKKTNKENKKVN